MASIDVLPSGKVRVRLVLAGKRQTRTFDTTEEAQQFARAAEVRTQVATGASGSMRYDAWAKVWFADHAPLVKASSAVRYKKILNLYLIPNLGFIPIGDITPAVIRGWQTHMVSKGLSPGTIKLARTILSMTLKAAADDGLIPANPVTKVKGIRIRKKQIRVLSESEVVLLSEKIRPRWSAMVTLAAYGGLRIGELCGLRRSEVDLDSQVISINNTVTKNTRGWVEGPAKTENSVRQITIPKFVVRDLGDHISNGYSNDRLVFTGTRGGRLQPDGFRKFPWAKALKDAGLEGVRFHDLRHTAVSIWIREGASPKLVAYRAGHASVQYVLDTYGHLFGDEDLELAERLDIGRPII